MDDRRVEVAVGDSVCIGKHVVTVIEIDGDEIVFRIDEASGGIGQDTRSSRHSQRPR